jgi:hypothetical protein
VAKGVIQLVAQPLDHQHQVRHHGRRQHRHASQLADQHQGQGGQHEGDTALQQQHIAHRGRGLVDAFAAAQQIHEGDHELLRLRLDHRVDPALFRQLGDEGRELFGGEEGRVGGALEEEPIFLAEEPLDLGGVGLQAKPAPHGVGEDDDPDADDAGLFRREPGVVTQRTLEVPASVDDASPEGAPLPEAVVGGVGAEGEDQGEDRPRDLVQVDGDHHRVAGAVGQPDAHRDGAEDQHASRDPVAEGAMGGHQGAEPRPG